MSAPAADLNAALRHTLTLHMRLGVFDPLVPSDAGSSPQDRYNQLGWRDIGTPATQQLAREAAQQSMVLLKNSGRRLPLHSGSHDTQGTVLLAGPTLEVKSGGYSGHGTGGPFTKPMPELLLPYLGVAVGWPPSKSPSTGSVLLRPGCKDASCDPADPETKSLIAEAVAAAKVSELVVVAVGVDITYENENNDRRALEGSIELPGAQLSLVQQVATVAPSPIIVLLTGSSLDISALLNNAKVGAILWRGYAGEAAGAATWDVIFGVVNPSGRLTSTWYPQAFVADTWKAGVTADAFLSDARAQPPRLRYYSAQNASFFDHHNRPDPTTGNPGRSHRFYTGTAVARFGDGLSYSTFAHRITSPTQIQVSLAGQKAYATLSTRRSIFRRDHPLARIVCWVSVNVTNSGPLPGATTLLGFLYPPQAAGARAPIQAVFGFEKVHLEVGQSALVALPVTEHDLTVTHTDGGRRVVAGLWVARLGNEGTLGAVISVA